MNKIPRWIPTVLAVVFGTGLLSPLVQANVQEWAKKNGWDQFLVQFAEPSAMDRLVQITQTGWFIFAAGFFIGGAVFLWLEYFLRGRSQGGTNAIVTGSVVNAASLAHALHMVAGSGLDVRVDKRKKQVQVGFRLQNSSDIALRFRVTSLSVVIDGKTVMHPAMVNGGAVVPRGGALPYMFAPIPMVIGKKDVMAIASIVYQYGPAGADEPAVREANYKVEVTISPTNYVYTILAENDGEI